MKKDKRPVSNIHRINQSVLNADLKPQTLIFFISDIHIFNVFFSMKDWLFFFLLFYNGNII